MKKSNDHDRVIAQWNLDNDPVAETSRCRGDKIVSIGIFHIEDELWIIEGKPNSFWDPADAVKLDVAVAKKIATYLINSSPYFARGTL